MDQQYDNNNRGAMFRNDKGDNPKRPDYRGTAQVAGVEYWVSGWVTTPKSGGNKFLAIKFEVKEAAPPLPEPEPGGDDLPF